MKLYCKHCGSEIISYGKTSYIHKEGSQTYFCFPEKYMKTIMVELDLERYRNDKINSILNE